MFAEPKNIEEVSLSNDKPSIPKVAVIGLSSTVEVIVVFSASVFKVIGSVFSLVVELVDNVCNEITPFSLEESVPYVTLENS